MFHRPAAPNLNPRMLRRPAGRSTPAAPNLNSRMLRPRGRNDVDRLGRFEDVMDDESAG
jgi:hypothetical protein